MKKGTKVFLLSIGIIAFICCFYALYHSEADQKYNDNTEAILTEFLNNQNFEHDVYCGSWIDINNAAHIAFTNLDYQETVESNGFVYEIFLHSLAELEELQNNIENEPQLKGKISGTSIIEHENAVEISYNQNEDLESIENVLSNINDKQIKIIYK